MFEKPGPGYYETLVLQTDFCSPLALHYIEVPLEESCIKGCENIEIKECFKGLAAAH